MGIEQTSCNLCGADDPVELFTGKDRLHHLPGRFPIVACRRCRLVYLDPRPDQASLQRYYPPGYAPFSPVRGVAGILQKCLRRREAARIRRSLPRGARLLEVGCAAGDLLVPLRAAGVSVAGVELSPHAAAAAREKYSLDVHTGSVFEVPFAERCFDAVVMRHVLEHFPMPLQALQKVYSLLKPGGRVFIVTPNFDSIGRRVFGRLWHGFDPPRHLVVFSVDTLGAMLTRAGFEIRQVRHSALPNDWIYSLRNLLEERGGKFPGEGLLSLGNPLALLLFLFPALLEKMLKMSGRISVEAVRKG